MSDKNKSALDKAEGVARRILERLGSKLDDKLEPSRQQTLGARQISDLTARVERAIESNLRKDKHGATRVAPNRFRVLLTYEETSTLTPQYMEAVGKELTSVVHEYINNRRYETSGPIEVEVVRDVFAKTVQVKEAFSGDESGMSGARAQANSAAKHQEQVETASISLEDPEGRIHRVALASSGSPACIGRTAGNAFRIDDASISRIHCSLALRSSGEIVVADLGSANGTYVNETMLAANEARALAQGDVIRLGDVTLTVSELD